MQHDVPRIESARRVLPTINVRGYYISGKETTVFYHTGPKQLVQIENPFLDPSCRATGRSLSISAAKKTREIGNVLLSTWRPSAFFECDTIEADYNDKQADEAARTCVKKAQEEIKKLPEWDACLRRLRAQVRDITSGSFKQDRHAKRREAAKEAIKEAARACVTQFYVNFDEVVVLAEEAVKELQIEDVMER